MKGKRLTIEEIKALKPGTIVYLTAKGYTDYDGKVRLFCNSEKHLKYFTKLESESNLYNFDGCVIGTTIFGTKIKIYEWNEIEEVKTYKTSGMIAMLEVNPRLIFESYVFVNCIKTDDKITIYADENNIVKYKYNETNLRNYKEPYFKLYEEWTLVKPEPVEVSLKEAIKAYEEGKTIECKLDDTPDLNGVYKLNKAMINQCLYKAGGIDIVNVGRMPLGTKEVLEGRWFILEGNE